MNEIDEKKILEFVGYTIEVDEDGKDFAVRYRRPGETHWNSWYDDIYSLDWQKEYLWPKLGCLQFYYLGKKGGALTKLAPYFANVELGDRCTDSYAEDPATAILKAVMELINE